MTNNSFKKGAQYVNKKASILNNTSIPQGESEANNMTKTCSSQGFTNILISYDINQPVEPNGWNGEAYPISIFSIMEFLEIDSINMTSLFLCIANFIRNRSVKHNMVNNVKQLQGFSQTVWQFISSIYKAG